MTVGWNDRLLLHFHSDLARVHERFVLTGDLEGGYYGVTPERKRVFMTLGDGAVKDIWLVDEMNVDRLPAGISAASAVRVKKSPLGGVHCIGARLLRHARQGFGNLAFWRKDWPGATVQDSRRTSGARAA